MWHHLCFVLLSGRVSGRWPFLILTVAMHFTLWEVKHLHFWCDNPAVYYYYCISTGVTFSCEQSFQTYVNHRLQPPQKRGMLNILTLNWMFMGQVLDKHHHYLPIYTLAPSSSSMNRRNISGKYKIPQKWWLFHIYMNLVSLFIWIIKQDIDLLESSHFHFIMLSVPSFAWRLGKRAPHSLRLSFITTQ